MARGDHALSVQERLRVEALKQAVAYHSSSKARPTTIGETAEQFHEFLKGDGSGK